MQDLRRVEMSEKNVRAIVWECHGHSRYTVYLPIGSDGHPDGKILHGGHYGQVCETFEEAVDIARRCMQMEARG